MINAQALVTGRVTQEGDGRLRAEFRLWDTFAGEQTDRRAVFRQSGNMPRRVAHMIADAIYERLTGEKGYFDTARRLCRRIRPEERPQEAARRSWTRTAPTCAISPTATLDRADAAPSPTRQEITYMSYEERRSRRSISCRSRPASANFVGNFPGMTFAPRFSPDGQKVIMSLLRDDGNSNIFADGPRGAAPPRGSPTTASIDTSPSYSPDGSQVVLHVGPRRPAADLCDGRRTVPAQTRISFGGGSLFDAGVVAARRPHRLHQAVWRRVPDRRDEDRRFGRAHPPAASRRKARHWAPNGRVLMFFREAAGAGGTGLVLFDRL